MSAFGLLPPPSWPSLVVAPFPVIPRSAVFLRLLISQVLKPFGCFFKRIWWHDPHSVLHQVGCGIVWEISGSSLISMEPSRPHDSGRFPRQTSFLPRTVVLIAFVPKAILAANEDKWGAPGRRFCSRIPINGWAPFLVQEMAITGKNYNKPSKPSRRTRRRLHFPLLTSS